MPTIYVSDEASKALDEARECLRESTGLNFDYTQAVLFLHSNWKNNPIKLLGKVLTYSQG